MSNAWAMLKRFWGLVLLPPTLLGIWTFPADWGERNAPRFSAAWQPIISMITREHLLWTVCILLFAWLAWTELRPIVIAFRAPKYPSPHREKMVELADALAQLQSLVMHPGNWSRMDPSPFQTAHAAKYAAARERVQKIAEEIRYDAQTRNSVVDFEHLCGMVVSDLLGRRDHREHLAQLEGISGPIMRRLHEGKGIDRSIIPWPQWIIDSDRNKPKERNAPAFDRPLGKGIWEERKQNVEAARLDARLYSDATSVFRSYIEGKPSYIALKRHFTPEFLAEVERSGRTAYSRGRGSALPAMSAKYLAELDRLAAEWELD